MKIEAQQIARLIGGLRLAIQERFSIQTVYMLTEAINLTTRVESQLIERGIKNPEIPLIHHVIR